MESRSQALRQAREKRTLLANPRMWKIWVWENMGWHWQLQSGNLMLYWSQHSRQFWCLLSEDGGAGGACFWTTQYYSSNPNRVVAQQLKTAREFINRCKAAVDSVKR